MPQEPRVDDGPGEDEHGARGVGRHPENHVEVPHDADGLAQVRQLVERLPQQDEAEDLQLLAEGVGDGRGEPEDQVEDLRDQEERHDPADGREVVRRHLPAEEAPGDPAPREFDPDHRAQEGEEQQPGRQHARAVRVPQSLEAVVEPDEGVALRPGHVMASLVPAEEMTSRPIAGAGSEARQGAGGRWRGRMALVLDLPRASKHEWGLPP